MNTGHRWQSRSVAYLVGLRPKPACGVQVFQGSRWPEPASAGSTAQMHRFGRPAAPEHGDVKLARPDRRLAPKEPTPPRVVTHLGTHSLAHDRIPSPADCILQTAHASRLPTHPTICKQFASIPLDCGILTKYADLAYVLVLENTMTTERPSIAERQQHAEPVYGVGIFDGITREQRDRLAREVSREIERTAAALTAALATGLGARNSKTLQRAAGAARSV